MQEGLNMKIIDEFTVNGEPDNLLPDEICAIAGNYEAEEMPDAETHVGEKRKPGKVAKLIKSAAFVAAVSAVTVAGVGATAGGTTAVNVDYLYLESRGNAIVYVIELDTPVENAEVVVYNNFTVRKQPIEGTIIEGRVDDLKANMEYKVSVQKDGKILSEKTIKTGNATSEDY